MSIAVIRRRSAASSPTIAFIGAWAHASICAAVTDLAANPVSALPSDPVSAYRNASAAIPRGDIDGGRPSPVVRLLLKSP
jgi:hypothetical protein